MVTQLPSSTKKDIIYPETDGQLIPENTKQFELIVLIKKNLDLYICQNYTKNLSPKRREALKPPFPCGEVRLGGLGF